MTADITKMPFRRSVSAIALLICVAMLCIAWHSIQSFGFHDPDDALRYVEARDFAAGQNWFDVSQHRVNPPLGGPMHWSRLIDVPLAAIMLLARPLLGTIMADRIALVTVPLLLTCALVFMVALAVRRLSGSLTAIAAIGLIGLSIPILIQFQPMRVDHHGWQILMAAVALWATFDPMPRRGGIVAGLALAFWTHVSSEGLPYAALFGGVFAIAFLREASTWPRLHSYASTLALTGTALLIGTHGWSDSAKFYCDAISPVYLLPLATVALVLLVAYHVLGAGTWQRRLKIPGLAAVAGAVLYVIVGGQCRGGPFGALDPIVYKYWYLNISEGRPVWEQSPLMMAIVIVPPLIGLAGSWLALRKEHDPERRFNWIVMMLISSGAYVVSLMVMRAVSTAYLFALPGTAMIILILLPKARALHTTPARILATLALCGLTPVGVTALAAVILPDDAQPEGHPKKSEPESVADPLCLTPGKLAGLAALPRGTILAPMDAGPAILAFTPHNVIATSHHRNNLGIRDVLLTFLGSTDRAHLLMAQHDVSYLAYCPHRTEIDDYTTINPKGFMHALESGTPPLWLSPIKMRPGETIKVYRVRYDAKS